MGVRFLQVLPCTGVDAPAWLAWPSDFQFSSAQFCTLNLICRGATHSSTLRLGLPSPVHEWALPVGPLFQFSSVWSKVQFLLLDSPLRVAAQQFGCLGNLGVRRRGHAAFGCRCL